MRRQRRRLSLPGEAQPLRPVRPALPGVVEKALLARSTPPSSVGIDHCRHSGESRNPFCLCLWPFARTSSLPDGEDTDTAIYIHLIRSGLECGTPSRDSKSNTNTKAKIIKWIPAFAGMTVVFPHRGTFSTTPSRSGPTCLGRKRSARICRNGPHRVFASMRYAAEAARRPALTGSVENPLDAFPPRSVHSSRLGRNGLPGRDEGAFPRICRRGIFASTGYAGEAARRPPAFQAARRAGIGPPPGLGADGAKCK